MTAGVGHGKAILVGEHHVLHGATALAIGVPALRTTVHLEPLPGKDLRVVADLPADALAMLTLACRLAGLQQPVHATVTSTVPMRRGLGSSAALAVATVRAATELSGQEVDLLAAAREVECLAHGRSSGLDPAAAAAQGAVRFAAGHVLGEVPVHPRLASACWLLLDLGSSVPTREAIAVADAHRAQLGPVACQELVQATTDAAESADQALTVGDLPALAAALSAAGAALEPLGVVDAAMRHVLALAHEAGALAAKQTGAGLGGMLLALLPTAQVASAVLALVEAHVRGHWLVPLVDPDSRAKP